MAQFFTLVVCTGIQIKTISRDGETNSSKRKELGILISIKYGKVKIM